MTDSEWDILKVLEENLKYFAAATTLLSGRTYPTLSISQAMEIMLKDYFERLNQVSSNLSRKEQQILIFENTLKKRVLKYIDEYFNKRKQNEEKENSKLAAYLDPAAFRYLNIQEVQLCEKKIKLIYPRKSKSNKALQNKESSQPKMDLPFVNKGSSFCLLHKFAEKLSIQPALNVAKELEIELEIANYKNSIKPDNISNELLEFGCFWRTYTSALPKLSILAKKVFY